MKKTNVMVCVTQQRTCDRLIKYGVEFLGSKKGGLFIIHVAHYDFKLLGGSEDSDALEYLYQKAMDYGASLTVVRSNDVLETLVDLIRKNKITHVILGESNELIKGPNMVSQLRERVLDIATIQTVPSLCGSDNQPQ